ncbi:MAG: cyclic nucleotide-binding domain-containing protein [Mariprofundales bacterium]
MAIENKSVTALQNEARIAMRESDYTRAAELYVEVYNSDKNLLDMCLRAAQCYERAGNKVRAAGFYLRVARLYAEDQYGMQSVAALRQFMRVSADNIPDEAREIVRLCHQMGIYHEDLDAFLPEKERIWKQAKQADLFDAFDGNDEEIMALINVRKLKDSEILCHAGDPGGEVYMLISGKIEAWFVIDNRRDYLGDVKVGELCGETSYFTGGSRTAEMVSSGESSLLVIPSNHVAKVQQLVPELGRRMESQYKNHILSKQLALTAIFSTLDGEAWAWAANLMTTHSFAPGQVIFQESHRGCSVYLIRKGFAAESITVRGEEILLGMRNRGDITGELAIANSRRRNSTVRAVNRCEVMRLAGEHFAELIKQYIGLVQALQARKKETIIASKKVVRKHFKGAGSSTINALIRDIWHAELEQEFDTDIMLNSNEHDNINLPI